MSQPLAAGATRFAGSAVVPIEAADALEFVSGRTLTVPGLRLLLQALGSSAMFRHNWVKTTGHVLDSRIRKMYNPRTGSGTISDSIPLYNYIVEFRAPNGETTKLEVEQHIETIEVDVGSEAPLLVSPDGKKAIFDKNDSKINVSAVYKADKQADKERFRKQLEG
jgi:hypothetical protein